MGQSVARGTCPVCGASVALRKDVLRADQYRLRDHQNSSGKKTVETISGRKAYPWCEGSGQPAVLDV